MSETVETVENVEKRVRIEDDGSSSDEEVVVARPLTRRKSESYLASNPVFQEQRECALLLLKARILLRKMIESKLYEERFSRGALSAVEVRDLINSQQDEDEETDFVTQITELKKNLMAEIRKNHTLEKDVKQLDKRIGLLIHNVGTLAVEPKKKKDKKGAVAVSALTAQKLDIYSQLFYLLQTEPKYLARLVSAIATIDDVDAMLDTILLTLYGDAFSPREEYMILTLFKIAIEQQMQHSGSVADFVKDQSILAKMVLAYNRRKQGQEFITSTLTSTVNEFLRLEGSLEINARKIHQKMITEEEVASGKKNDQRMLSDDEIVKLPNVAAEVDERAKNLAKACDLFLETIVRSASRVPYGLRWICRQLRTIAHGALPNVTEDDLNKMTSYFVYYRFINLGVVSPESCGIEVKLTPQNTFNLVEVSKVLHHLFSFTPFDTRTEKWYVPMNKWMESRYDKVREFIAALLDVEDPEDFLQVDRYNELTQMVKPSILISVSEISLVHRFTYEYLDRIALSGSEDPLRVIMRDLGAPEEYTDEDREIQLTLNNRFPGSVDDNMSETMQIFHQAKMALISILRQIPKDLEIAPEVDEDGNEREPSLMVILTAGDEWARKHSNDHMQEQIEKLQGFIKRLEEAKMVSADDGHRELLKAVTLEIANRAQIRSHQKKELARLNLALRKAGEQQAYLNEQIEQYNMYLTVVRERHVGAGPKKGRKKAPGGANIIGPFKFSYSELVKKGVIISSEVPKALQKATKISITSETPGVFDVQVTIPTIASEAIQIFLDDLLEKQSANQEIDERSNITLDVNMTIHLLNKLFKK